MMKKNISYDINQEHLSLATSASKFKGLWQVSCYSGGSGTSLPSYVTESLNPLWLRPESVTDAETAFPNFTKSR